MEQALAEYDSPAPVSQFVFVSGPGADPAARGEFGRRADAAVVVESKWGGSGGGEGKGSVLEPDG